VICLDGFWDFVSYRPGLSATAGEWRRCLGEDGWRALRGRLLTGDGIAQTCVGVDGRTLHVVAVSGRRYSLVCPVTGNLEQTGLIEADVRAYRLNVTPLRSMIAEALGVTPDPQPVRQAPRAFAFGSWAPVAGADIPAFMILPPTARLLASEIDRLLLECAGGFVLLVPKQPKLRSSLRAQIERQQATIIPLSEVIMCDASGRLSASPLWQTYQDAYCSKHYSDHMVPAPPPYEFRKEGDFWVVRFAGKQTVLKDTVGMTYIAELLAQPYKKVFAPDLLQAVSGQPVSDHAGDAGELADDQAVEEAKRRYLELQEELDEANRNNDMAAQSRLEAEMEKILDYLKTVKGLGDRTRKGSDDADKIRRSITQAIGRVVKSLGEADKLPEASQHLSNALNTGLFMSYDPEEVLPWNE